MDEGQLVVVCCLCNAKISLLSFDLNAGPILSARTDATSIMNVSDFIEGKSKSLMPWVCDVRDIGRAHVLAIEVSYFPIC